nr:hypothetical protein [uncultured Roseococcus sp.]
MSALAGVTARMLARYGRPMELRRRAGKSEELISVERRGKDSAYKPTELVGLVQQGDLKVVIGPDLGPITAPLKKPDQILIDGRPYTIQGAIARYVGSAIDGYELWVRGA